MEFPVLESERLVLRKIKFTDADNIFLGLSDPEVVKYYGVSLSSKGEAHEQLRWFTELDKTNSGIWWAICSKEDGQFLGAAGLNNKQPEHKKAEIGFWLLKENWRKGYIHEAVPLITNYAFEVLKLHRIEATVEPENSNCKSTLTKLKFQHEGTMTDCEIKNGNFISLDIFATLNPN